MQNEQIEKNLNDFRYNINTIEAMGIGQLFGQARFPGFLGRSLALMCGSTAQADETMNRYLSLLPSETTLSERKLLFNFFVNFWDGQKDVLEVGPFLGGTSRAIAMGMVNNPRHQSGCKLYTYDKFRDYYKPERLLETLAPMFQAGVLDDGARQKVIESSSFKEVYELLHAGQEYSEILVAQTGVLPDARDQTVPSEDLFNLPEDRAYSAVFVDGAKSWFGTKEFMRQSSLHTEPGAYYLFQDFGAYTCFWIPVYLELMKEYYQLVTYVDHTYAYRQIKPVTPEDISAKFPDSPRDFSIQDFQAIFRNLYNEALTMDNTYILMNFQLQHAAALAYLGQIDEARNRITDLLKSPFALQYKNWIWGALQAPTYTPDGNVKLI